MVRSPTIRSEHVGPAIAGLFLPAMLVIALALVVVRTSPPMHGPPGLSESAREFIHRLLPSAPLPDQHPRVLRPQEQLHGG